MAQNYFLPKNHFQKLTPTTHPKLQNSVANQQSMPDPPKITLSIE
jgi:hypothetical protein